MVDKLSKVADSQLKFGTERGSGMRVCANAGVVEGGGSVRERTGSFGDRVRAGGKGERRAFGGE